MMTCRGHLNSCLLANKRRDQPLTHSEKLPIRCCPDSLFLEKWIFYPTLQQIRLPVHMYSYAEEWDVFCTKMYDITITQYEKKLKKIKIASFNVRLIVSKHRLLQQAGLKTRLNSGSGTKENKCNIEAFQQVTRPWSKIKLTEEGERNSWRSCENLLDTTQALARN